MTHSAPADVRLGNGTHLNGRHDACVNTLSFKGIHQGHGVHHCGQHTHIIRSRTIHAPLQSLLAAPQVARTDDYSHIHTHFTDFFDTASSTSMPKPDLPPSASPLNLSRIRLYFNSAIHTSSHLLSLNLANKKI